MSLGILTSKLQTVKSLKDSEYLQTLRNHDYVQRIQELVKSFSDTAGHPDYSHVTTRKTRAQMIRLSAAVCGIELCYAAETAFVSPILLKLGVPVAFMTLVWCVSPFLGFFLVPVMGSLSDRCPLKLGRRRPFILLFSLGIMVGLVLVPNGEDLGLLAGDTGTDIADADYVNDTTTILRRINATNNLVLFQNGTKAILRSDFSPEWPSTKKLPHKHVIGILLTVLGVAMLDFNCDACQSPCRTYLLDISVPEDHSRGLTSFTVMAGLGGSFGYLMGGIDWESTSFGTALGGHVRVVFTGVLILFVVFVFLTMTSFKEIPLKDLGVTKEQLQRKVKTVKKAKYKKFVNESSDDETECSESEHVKERNVSYGTLDNKETTENITNNGVEPNKRWTEHKHSITENEVSVQLENNRPETYNRYPLTKSLSEYKDLSDEASLKTYLRSIVRMPRSLLILCLTNLFCWMSLVCYSLYFTDFVGQSVYGGDPQAPAGSSKHLLYDEGVRLGSLGMSLYSFSCALYSMAIEHLVERFSAKPVYVWGQLVYTAGMVILAICRHPVAVILLSPCAGIMYATLFTMPYLLVAHYHSNGKFSQDDDKGSANIRGLGTDVALVSSMVFLAQFILSLCMGSLVHFTGSTVTIVIAASVLSFCGSVCATQVTYLDL
ncbi:proton-associated sugar transporter A-like [Mercenaria mercenaria]|uniref:proton-associated sugar transporter A-like n=1 Tax=Mercenaria mercenaria TaxID=6596 RepID=UPI00234F4CA4|nr:proton-associated sugar transporter A-like [Mercenaria mercenaria]